MKQIVYPLELFFWNAFDSNGNVVREVRDACKNTVFIIRINGRETFEAKRFTNELAPLIVKLLNENNLPIVDVPVDVQSNGNVQEPVPIVRKRGRPRKNP